MDGERQRRRRRPIVAAVLPFTIAGCGGMLLLSVAAAIVLSRVGTREAVRNAREVAWVVGRGVVEPGVTDGVVDGDPASLAAFDRLVRRRVLMDPVVRVKLWTVEGNIVYSDEERLVGLNFPLDRDERSLLQRGGSVAHVSDLSSPENRFERSDRKLLEVYQGVRTPSGQHLLFETYLRFSSVTANGRRIWRTFLLPLIASLLVLEGVQVPLAWSLARRLREGQRQQEALLSRALEASTDERRRVARDLHDGVVQTLAGVGFSLGAAVDRLRRHEPVDGASLEQAAAGTRQAIRELRTLVVDIHPPNLHQVGIRAALVDLVAPLAANGLEASVDVAPGLRLDPGVEAVLFRAAQEALRNVASHSGARHVSVSVAAEDGRVSMLVRDDGHGFAPDDVPQPDGAGPHLGLRLLSELAREAGGALQVDTQPGRGTALRMVVPRP